MCGWRTARGTGCIRGFRADLPGNHLRLLGNECIFCVFGTYVLRIFSVCTPEGGGALRMTWSRPSRPTPYVLTPRCRHAPPRVQFSGWLFRLTSLPTVLIDAAFCWQRNLACCPFPLKYLILVSTKPAVGQTAILSLDLSHHFE